jgi:hypothetical protein
MTVCNILSASTNSQGKIVLIVQIDDPTPPEQLKCTVRTFVRPLDKFPPNFEKSAKVNAKGSILPMQNERMLLNSLLSKLAPLVPRPLFF